jgi:chromosomal replication initiator protein
VKNKENSSGSRSVNPQYESGRYMDKVQVRESTIKSIQEAVAHQFGLSVEELKQESTRREVAVPRQIAIYLTKQMTDASLPEIGRKFGGKHHTTVMHSIAKIHDRRRTDPAMNAAIIELLKTLRVE